MRSHRRPCALSAVLLSAWLLPACGRAPTARPRSDAGFVDPRAALCPDPDAGPAAPPSFDVIQQVFTQNCVGCHTLGNDLDLRPGHAWANIVGRPPPPWESCGGTLVVPSDPDHSYLYQKLSTANPCSGGQMPRSDLAAYPLPDCVIKMVHDWIAAGALGASPDDAGGQ
jgi:hypothetical protein